MLRRSNALPHDRSSALITLDGLATSRFERSIDLWSKALLFDDSITPPIEPIGDRFNAKIIANQHGTFAGRLAVSRMVMLHAPDLLIEWKVDDGETIAPEDNIAFFKGSSNQLLMLERAVLNILGRLSGISTCIRAWNLISTIPIAATRKTTWGLLDKWAVHLGGGLTHRLDRSDALMIKENDMATTYPELSHNARIKRSLKDIPDRDRGAFIVIETRSEEEAITAAETWAEMGYPHRLTIMLDNLPAKVCSNVDNHLTTLGIRSNILLEASGGIDFDTLESWSHSGVDLLSSSSIHRGTTPLDMSLLIDEVSTDGT